MKKNIIVILFLLLVILLTGCYYDRSKLNMELIDIKVYDIDDNQVFGEYKDYYTNLINLNSTAPVLNYYYLEVEESSTYTVKFYFASSRSKILSGIKITNLDNEETFTCDNVEKIDDNFVVTYTFSDINSSYHVFKVISWLNEEGMNTHFGESGSNTYIKGVYFYINEKVEA